LRRGRRRFLLGHSGGRGGFAGPIPVRRRAALSARLRRSGDRLIRDRFRRLRGLLLDGLGLRRRRGGNRRRIDSGRRRHLHRGFGGVAGHFLGRRRHFDFCFGFGFHRPAFFFVTRRWRF